jgi:hypothetical protein
MKNDENNIQKEEFLAQSEGEKQIENKSSQIARKIREMIEYLRKRPKTYFIGKIYTLIYFSVIILAILDTILATLPTFANDYTTLNILTTIEFFCMIFFSMEFAIRLSICPDLIEFCLDVLNYIDLIPLIPFYLNLITKITGQVTVTALGNTKDMLKMFLLFKFFRR